MQAAPAPAPGCTTTANTTSLAGLGKIRKPLRQFGHCLFGCSLALLLLYVQSTQIPRSERHVLHHGAVNHGLKPAAVLAGSSSSSIIFSSGGITAHGTASTLAVRL